MSLLLQAVLTIMFIVAGIGLLYYLHKKELL